MPLLAAIIIGIVIGTIAGFFLLENVETLFISSLVGLAGSLLATGLYTVLDIGPDGIQLAATTGMLVAAIGAITAVLLFSGIQKIILKGAAKASQAGQDKLNKD